MSDHRGPVVPMDEDDPHTPHGDPFQPPPPNGNDHEQTIPEDHQEQIPEPETPPEHQGDERENSQEDRQDDHQEDHQDHHQDDHEEGREEDHDQQNFDHENNPAQNLRMLYEKQAYLTRLIESLNKDIRDYAVHTAQIPKRNNKGSCKTRLFQSPRTKIPHQAGFQHQQRKQETMGHKKGGY